MVTFPVVEPDVQLEVELAYEPFKDWLVDARLVAGLLPAGRLSAELPEDDAADCAPGQPVPTAETVAVPDAYAAVILNESPLAASTVYAPWPFISLTAAMMSVEVAQARSFAEAKRMPASLMYLACSAQFGTEMLVMLELKIEVPAITKTPKVTSPKMR